MIRQQTEEYAELLLIDAMDEWDNDLDAEDAADEEEQASAGKEKVNKDKDQSAKKALPEEDNQDMEADCRVIVNVRYEVCRKNDTLIPFGTARCADIHLQSSRPYRVGSLLASHAGTIHRSVLRRDRPHG